MIRDPLTLRRYRDHRRDGLAASLALRWAKESRKDDAFEGRFQGVGRYQSSFCNDDGADVYELASASDAIRVELAIMPDYHGRDDFEPFDADATRRYFRETEKLGKAETERRLRLAVEREARFQERRERGDFGVYGVAVRVFYNTPRLESGEPIAEDSCWGYESDGSDLWNFAREVYSTATHGLCAKLRSKRREERRAIMAEAFAANFAL